MKKKIIHILLCLVCFSCSSEKENKTNKLDLFLLSDAICNPDDIATLKFHAQEFAEYYINKHYIQWYPEDITALINNYEDCHRIKEDGSLRTHINITFTAREKFCDIDVQGNFILRKSNTVEFYRTDITKADCFGLADIHEKAGAWITVSFNIVDGVHHYSEDEYLMKKSSAYKELEFTEDYYASFFSWQFPKGKSKRHFKFFSNGRVEYYFPHYHYKDYFHKGSFRLVDEKIEISLNGTKVHSISEPFNNVSLSKFINRANHFITSTTMTHERRFVSDSDKQFHGENFGNDYLFKGEVLNNGDICLKGYRIKSKSIWSYFDWSFVKKDYIGEYYLSTSHISSHTGRKGCSGYFSGKYSTENDHDNPFGNHW